MGCTQSKKKSRSKKVQRQEVNNHHDGEGKLYCDEPENSLQKQLERFEMQLKILKEVISANGSQERAELLKGHAHEELCAMVQSFAEKVTTETAAELNVLHEQKSRCAAEEHGRKLEELQRAHDQAMASLTASHRAVEESFRLKVDQLVDELQMFNELKKRVKESTFKKDLERNIQAHGSPGAFWESEQESLLFVIEMKSKRVQELSSKLQELQAVVEKNLALEDQIVHVLQQNEDLSVRIDNYQSLIQTLSKEQQELQGTLQRQTSANQKLSQEREQLMFKLRHKDSCPTIHLPAMVPEISPR